MHPTSIFSKLYYGIKFGTCTLLPRFSRRSENNFLKKYLLRSPPSMVFCSCNTFLIGKPIGKDTQPKTI